MTGHSPVALPSSTEPTARESAAALRAGRVSAVELAERALRRIREDGRAAQPVDAWAAVAAEDVVLSAAAEVDRDLRRGVDLHPLAGIPYGVKDLLDTADLPTEAGSARWRGRRPAVDAEAVARARGGRGTLLGKTRTHEFAAGVTTPPTANPWDRSRTPGGSSGGSAAAVAAGECVWAIGTDTLGSVRMPAALCGVVGLKPTYDLISRHGVAPLSTTLDHVGVLALDCADAALALDLLTGHAPQPLAAPPAGLVIGVPDEGWVGEVEPAVATAYASALQTLIGSARARVRTVRMTPPDEYVAVGFEVLAAEAADWHAPLLAEEVAPEDDYGADVRAILDHGRDLTAEQRADADRELRRLRSEADDLMDEVDVLLLPATPFVAPPREAAEMVWPSGSAVPLGVDMPRFTALGNLTGLPALVVPVELAEGLPVAVQLVAGRRRERDLLALGATLQQRL